MKQKIIFFFTVLCLLVVCFPHRQKAGEQSEEASILLSDLCSKLGTIKPADYGSKSNNAVWEQTSSDLYRRFGSVSKKVLPSTVPHTEGSSTWGTSVLQGKHSRTIQATWDKAKNKLDVTIQGNAKGTPLGKGKERVGGYIIRIHADVVEEKDKQGNTLLRTRLPQTNGVEVLADGCDEKERIDLNGTWTDNLGMEWTIKHSPIMCTDPQATITLMRINKNNHEVLHKGTISDWTIDAEHNIVDPDAVDEPEPLWVRRIIASGTKGDASFALSLSPHRKEDGTLSLEGSFKGFNITWNPEEKYVTQVFDGYEKPIVFTQAKPKNEFRIVRIEEDIEAWRDQAEKLQTKNNQVSDQIKYYSERIEDNKLTLAAQHREHRDIREGFSKRVGHVRQLGIELNDPSRSGPSTFELERQRDDLLQKKKFLENELKLLKQELSDLTTKLAEIEPQKEKMSKKYEELENRKEVKQSLIPRKNKELLEIDKKLNEAMNRLAELKNKKKELEEEYKRQQESLKDDHFETMKKLKHIESRIETALKELARNQDELTRLEEERIQITQAQKGLDLNTSPWVEEIMVKDNQGNVIGHWGKWLPLEKIKEIEAEGKALKEIRDNLKKEKEKGFEIYSKAAWDAVKALEEVRKAIMKSAAYQAGIESVFYFVDLLPELASKGPLGAATSAAGKLAWAWLDDGFPEFRHVSDDELKTLEKRIYEEYGMKADERFYESNADEWFDMAYTRTVKEVWLRPVKQRVNRYVMSHFHEKLTKQYTNMLLEEVMKAQNIKAQTELGIDRTSDIKRLRSLGNKCTKLNKQMQSLLDTKKPVRGGKEFLFKVAKDIAKPLLMEGVRYIEDNAWSSFLWTDMQARAAFNAYRHVNKLYWEASDSYAGWEVAHKDLVDKFDPKSGFKEFKSLPLKEGFLYTVELKLPNPEGWRGEQVWLGIKKTSPVGEPTEHQYSIKAENLNPDNQKGNVMLKVKYGQ